MQPFYLNNPNGKNIPVEIELHNGQLTLKFIGTRRVVTLLLAGDVQSLAAELASDLRPETPQPWSTGFNWDWLTNDYVVKYFEQSTDLAEIAGDVRAVLGRQAAQVGPQAKSRVQRDLEAIEHLVKPSKADISEVLFGKRTYSGARFERITEAYNAYYSTTTPTERTSMGDSRDLAA